MCIFLPLRLLAAAEAAHAHTRTSSKVFAHIGNMLQPRSEVMKPGEEKKTELNVVNPRVGLSSPCFSSLSSVVSAADHQPLDVGVCVFPPKDPFGPKRPPHPPTEKFLWCDVTFLSHSSSQSQQTHVRPLMNHSKTVLF